MTRIVKKALAKKPAARYQSAAAFKSDLERLLAGGAPDADPGDGTVGKRVAQSKKLARTVLTIATLGAVVVPLYMVANFQFDSQDTSTRKSRIAVLLKEIQELRGGQRLAMSKLKEARQLTAGFDVYELSKFNLEASQAIKDVDPLESRVCFKQAQDEVLSFPDEKWKNGEAVRVLREVGLIVNPNLSTDQQACGLNQYMADHLFKKVNDTVKVQAISDAVSKLLAAGKEFKDDKTENLTTQYAEYQLIAGNDTLCEKLLYRELHYGHLAPQLGLAHRIASVLARKNGDMPKCYLHGKKSAEAMRGHAGNSTQYRAGLEIAIGNSVESRQWTEGRKYALWLQELAGQMDSEIIDLEAQWYLAIFDQQLGKTVRARKSFEEIVRRGEQLMLEARGGDEQHTLDRLTLLNTIANSYLSLSEFTKAEKCARQALSENPHGNQHWLVRCRIISVRTLHVALMCQGKKAELAQLAAQYPDLEMGIQKQIPKDSVEALSK